jgi:hypothetical protein
LYRISRLLQALFQILVTGALRQDIATLSQRYHAQKWPNPANFTCFSARLRQDTDRTWAAAQREQKEGPVGAKNGMRRIGLALQF